MAPQARGRAFEKFLGEIFTQEKIRHRLSYRPKGEEIDGAFWLMQRTFLLEAKWLAEPVPASAVYAFKGKVDGKFDHTQGVFLSMSGFSKDCADAITRGKSLNILLFDGKDIEALASGVQFSAILEEKLFAAGQTGNVYLPWEELKKTQELIATIQAESVPKNQDTPTNLGLIAICEGPTDKVVLESLISYVAKKIGKAVFPKFLVSYGKRPLMDSIAPSLASLLSLGVSGSAAVVTVFDADTTDPIQIESQRQRAKEALKELPASWPSHVAVATPEIEYWIGLPEPKPLHSLRQNMLGIDWNVIAQHNREVADLTSFLEKVI
jgi:hypothetical protein